MARRSYRGNSVATTVAVGISAGDTTLSVADGSGLPVGTNPFVITVNANKTGEEKILVGGRSGNTLSSLTRGYDGTTAGNHLAGESVTHTISAIDLDEANAHINATSAAHAATAISNTPAGGIASTTVQAALNELDAEKSPTGHTHASTLPLFARKTANQDVTSSTALVNDLHLAIALTASGVWSFKALLFVSGDPGGDIRLAFTVPAGATLRWGSAGGLNTGSTSASSTNDANADFVAGSGTFENYGVFSAGSLIVLQGVVRTAATTGNLQLQWAQDTSSGTATTVGVESFLVATQVA